MAGKSPLNKCKTTFHQQILMRRTYLVFISAPNTILTAGRQHTRSESIVSPRDCCQHLNDCVSWLRPQTCSILMCNAERAHSSDGLIIDSRPDEGNYKHKKARKAKTFSKVLRCGEASDCSLPAQSLGENERGVLWAAAAAARSRDLGSLIKLELLNFMPPVRLQFESTSVTVIDGSVTLCWRWISLNVLLTFSAQQCLQIFTINTIHFYRVLLGTS